MEISTGFGTVRDSAGLLDSHYPCLESVSVPPRLRCLNRGLGLQHTADAIFEEFNDRVNSHGLVYASNMSQASHGIYYWCSCRLNLCVCRSTCLRIISGQKPFHGAEAVAAADKKHGRRRHGDIPEFTIHFWKSYMGGAVERGHTSSRPMQRRPRVGFRR